MIHGCGNGCGRRRERASAPRPSPFQLATPFSDVNRNFTAHLSAAEFGQFGGRIPNLVWTMPREAGHAAVRRGVCEYSEASAGNCELDFRGTWTDPSASASIAGCVESCRACTRCGYISYRPGRHNASQGVCKWFHQCRTSTLYTSHAGALYYTRQVRGRGVAAASLLPVPTPPVPPVPPPNRSALGEASRPPRLAFIVFACNGGGRVRPIFGIEPHDVIVAASEDSLPDPPLPPSSRLPAKPPPLHRTAPPAAGRPLARELWLHRTAHPGHVRLPDTYGGAHGSRGWV